ncbi:MAG: hypothetical protein ABI091_26605 [Ferruginibacter sp.]
MDYKEKLKKTIWQKRRLQIFERDKWVCQSSSCKTPDDNLNVHHKLYFDYIDPWAYPDDMLVTLCNTCHTKENDREKLEKHLANTLQMKGFFVSDLLAMSCLMETDELFTKSLLNILRKFQNG